MLSGICRRRNLTLAGTLALICALLSGCLSSGKEASGPGFHEDVKANFPQKLHTVPPGKSGDVSGAFVTPSGRRLLLNGFNMFPVFDNPVRAAWTAADYKSISAKGFSAVRLLMPWRVYEPARGQFSKDAFAKLDDAIRQARAARLYVILVPFLEDETNRQPDWSQVTETSGCVNGDRTGDKALDKILSDGKPYLQELARRYKGNATVAAYDLIGEPHGTNLQNCLLELYSRLIEWVRAVDKDKIAILEPGWGSSDMSPQRVDPAHLRGDKSNVVHSWHLYYAGGADEGYNRFGLNEGRSTGDGLSGYPDPSKKGDIEAQVKVHVDYARRADLPLFVGEYGINPREANAAEWARQVTEILDKYGVGRTWWLYDKRNQGFALKTDKGAWLPFVDVIRPH
jgi:hypothetical protein